MTGRLPFKATNDNSASDVIVVSFSAHWHATLLNGSIRRVFRKRVPKSFEPKLMYIYVGSPHSEIIGRAEIKSIQLLDYDHAVALSESAHLTKEELIAYFGSYRMIGCYTIGNIELAKLPLSLAKLHEQSGFHPPQSFVRASLGASRWLETKNWKKR